MEEHSSKPTIIYIMINKPLKNNSDHNNYNIGFHDRLVGPQQNQLRFLAYCFENICQITVEIINDELKDFKKKSKSIVSMSLEKTIGV